MPAIRPRRCNDCGVDFDVLAFPSRGYVKHMDTGERTEEPTCTCGSTNLTKLVSGANVIWTGDEGSQGKIYPYYDRSLQMRISNKKQHDQIMKARGLKHATVDDIEKIGSQERSRNDEIDRTSAEQDRMIEEHPGYREYRRARDKGQLVDHLPKEQQAKAQKSLMRNAKG